MSKDLISLADLLSGTGGIDTLASAIRKAAAPSDKFTGKNTFKARVLRPIGTTIDPKDIQNMQGIEAGDQNRFTGGGYQAYYVMILEDSPHSFLPVPAAQGDAPTAQVGDNQLLQSMYTTALYSGPLLSEGEEVMIRMEKKGFSYDTDIAYIVERIGSNKARAIKEQQGAVTPSSAYKGSPGPNRSPAAVGSIPEVPEDPGDCPWSGGTNILVATWNSADPRYSKWNGKQLRNGMLEQSGMLVTDKKRGAQLVPPAMDDFLKLAAAYEAKFPGKTLKASGYRSYAGQVKQRMRRNATKCGTTSKTASGKEIGLAATPGTSAHGWGAAVDVSRREWTKGGGVNSPEFQWINKFSKKFNFVFGVRNEAWHLDWMLFGAQVGGMVKSAQTAWSDAGVNDNSITLT